MLMYEDNEFQWTLILTYFPFNDPPFLKKAPENVVLYIGEKESFQTGVPSNDTVEVKINYPKRFNKFSKVTTDQSTFVTKFEIEPKDISAVGSYNIEIILRDTHPEVPAKEAKYSFFVLVKQKLSDKGVIVVKDE